MKGLGRVSLAAAIFMLATAHSYPACARTLNDVLLSAEKLMKSGRLPDAERLLAQEYENYKRKGEIENSLILRLNLGGIKYQRRAFTQALDIFKEVYQARRGLLGANHEHTRMALQNVVQTLLDLTRNFDAANELNEYSLQSNLSADNVAWAIQWIRDIKGDYEKQSDFDNALRISDLLLTNLAQRKMSKSDREYLSIVLNRSAILAAAARISEASDTIEAALAEAQPSETNIQMLVQLHANRALILDHGAKTSKAVNEVLAALLALDKVNLQKSKETATLYQTLARLYYKQQYLSIAKAAVEKSLEILNADKDISMLKNRTYIESYALLGNIYSSLSAKEQAFGALAFSAKQSCDVFGDRDPDCIAIGLDLAQAYVRFQLWNYAERELSNSLNRLSSSKSASTNHWIMAYTGSCQTLARTDSKKALEFCQRAYDLAKEAPKPEAIDLNAAAQLARQHLDAGRTAQSASISAALLSQAVTGNIAATRYEEFSELLSVMLSALAKLGDSGKDRSILDIAFVGSELARRKPSDLVLDRVRAAKDPVDPKLRKALLRREYLRGQLDRVQARLVSMQVSSDAFQTENRALKDALNEEVGRLKQSLVVLGEQTDKNNKVENTPVGSFSLSDLQSALAEDQICVVYYKSGRGLFAWIVDKAQVSVIELPLAGADLDALIAGVRPPPGSLPGPKERDILRGFKTEAAHSLFEKIWLPLEPRLRNKRVVYVIPDGPLSRLPFSAMLTEKVGATRQLEDLRKLPWLVLRPYAISVLSRPADIAQPSRGVPNREARYVGVGAPKWDDCSSTSSSPLTLNAVTDAVEPGLLCQLVPLSLAKSELEEIQKILPSGSLLLTDNAASEAALRRLDQSGELESASLMVFSTHGLAAGELDMFTNPMRVGARDNIGIPLMGDAATQYIRESAQGISEKQLKELEGSLLYMWYNREVPDTRFRASAGLVLSSSRTETASDPTNDGFLSAAEIANLNLQADLVILSACNTASQNELAGAEVFLGLTEAFLAAGARSLIVSQWIVASDAAKEVTVSVVKLLHDHEDLNSAQALQQSQSTLIRSGPDPHPFYWAPFTYVGNAARPRLR